MSNELLGDFLKELLTSAAVLDWVRTTHGVFFERGKILLSSFNAGANAGVPGRGTALYQRRQPPISANRGSNLQSAREIIHSSDVGVEEVNRLKALAPILR